MVLESTLLSELERQQRYLEKLPKDYKFPLFNARLAVESQRKSAYRGTASAAREIVDNAVEAGADRVDVVFREEHKNLVNAVAFVDNGPGMLPEMARFALSWGGGTHHDDPRFIGKFGFGLPNASINQTRLVEVYTKTGPNEPVWKAWLDLRTLDQWGEQSVPEPVVSELPDWITDYLKRKRFNFDHGVVVVWERPDRLSARRGSTLKEQLLDDFGVVYRYLLLDPERPLKILVKDVEVRPVDPLFLEPTALYYDPPIGDVDSPTGGGARLMDELFVPVKYFEDERTGESRLERVESLEAIDETDATLRALGTIHVRVVRFPVDFAPGTGDTKRFRFRKSRRGMSFVRARREIETVDVFPKDRESQGLGAWPLLQTFAYHWGIEVRFGPQLDDVFGITNDKQGVRPIEDFWRVLTDEGVDALARRENGWQDTARKAEKERKRTESQERDPRSVSPAEGAAHDADTAASDAADVPDHQKEAAAAQLDDESERRAAQTGEQKDEVREAILKQGLRKRYQVEYFDSPDGPFYEPLWVGTVVTVRINRSHRFYDVLYRSLIDLAGGRDAKEAVDVLLITLARAELTASNTDMLEWYQGQRRRRWSPYLDDAMASLQRRLASADDRTEEGGGVDLPGKGEAA